jgi:hypothetical protein
MNSPNIDRVQGEQISEENAVLVYRLCVIGGHPPLCAQPIVMPSLGGGAEHPQHGVGISDIQHKQQS